MRRVILSALVAATFGAGFAIPAAAEPLHHFSRDGETYSYVAARKADGSILLRGTVETSGKPFALRLRGDHVEGTLGMSTVDFRITPDTAARLDDELAAAPTTLAAN